MRANAAALLWLLAGVSGNTQVRAATLGRSLAQLHEDPSVKNLVHVVHDVPKVTFFSHYKTGRRLINTAIQHCFRRSNDTIDVTHLSPNHDRDARIPFTFQGRKFIHIVRDPVGTVISGYQYHRANLSTEPWLHENSHAQDIFKYDWMLQSHLQENETYQQFLRRVPMALGMRAEVVRMVRSDISAQVRSNELCDQGSSWCMEVCMERFADDSSTYNNTWAQILRFVGIQNASSMNECLSNLDMNAAHITPSIYDVPIHPTDDFVAAHFVTQAREVIQNVDEALYQGELGMLARRYACPQYRPMSPAPVDLKESNMQLMQERWRRLVEHVYA